MPLARYYFDLFDAELDDGCDNCTWGTTGGQTIPTTNNLASRYQRLERIYQEEAWRFADAPVLEGDGDDPGGAVYECAGLSQPGRHYLL